ncbi:MAG: PTPS-like type 4, partial [uncultured Rubrobacteraceae bacterium]
VRGIRRGAVRGGPPPEGGMLRAGGPHPRPHVQARVGGARRGSGRRRELAGCRRAPRDGGRGGCPPALPGSRRGPRTRGQEHHRRGSGGVLLGWDLTFPPGAWTRHPHGAGLGVAAGLRRPRGGPRL